MRWKRNQDITPTFPQNLEKLVFFQLSSNLLNQLGFNFFYNFFFFNPLYQKFQIFFFSILPNLSVIGPGPVPLPLSGYVETHPDRGSGPRYYTYFSIDFGKNFSVYLKFYIEIHHSFIHYLIKKRCNSGKQHYLFVSIFLQKILINVIFQDTTTRFFH